MVDDVDFSRRSLVRGRAQAGVTYLELILVLLIIGVLGAVAAPRLTGGVFEVDPTREAGQRLINDLTRARAVSQACPGEPVTMEVTSNGSVVEWSPEEPAGNPCLRDYEEGFLEGEAEGVFLDGGSFELTFRRFEVEVEVDAEECGEPCELVLEAASGGGGSFTICVHGHTGAISRGPCESYNL